MVIGIAQGADLLWEISVKENEIRLGANTC